MTTKSLVGRRSTARVQGVSILGSMLLAGVVLLPLLGRRRLMSWDEGIYAEVSREMLGHSWWKLAWNGQPWFEKPPLMLWLTAIFFHLFGVSEFWARAGSALSGMAVTALVHTWLVRRQTAPAMLSAWIATIVLLSTFGFQRAARSGELDVALALFCMVALWGLAVVEEGRDHGWWIFWAGLAAASMTKGAAIAPLVLTAGVLAVVNRWTLRRLARSFWLGFAAFLAAVLPWHVAMTRCYGPAFLDTYLGYHVLARATRAIENHPTAWWFYLGVLVVSAPPFVALYPFALAAAVRRRGLRVWAIFALVSVVFWSALRTRLPHYIVPAYPALALVTGAWAAEKLQELDGRLRARRTATLWGFRAAAAAASLAVFGVAAALTAHGRYKLHSAQTIGRPLLHADDRELIGLLREGFRTQPAVPGPLLAWYDGPPASIATAVFYSRRQVQQVGRTTVAATDPSYDRYLNTPETLADALAGLRPGELRLLVLDRTLLGQLPPGVSVSPIAESPGFLLITIGQSDEPAKP